jgi:hypothetical protein
LDEVKKAAKMEAMSDLETLPVVDPIIDPSLDDPLLDEGDHDRFSHYVKKDRILPSAVEGTPLTALCGKKWVPSRDPKNYPVCPTCKEIYEGLPDGSGGDSGDDD